MHLTRLLVFASIIFVACNAWAQSPEITKADDAGPEVSGASAKSVVLPFCVFDAAIDPSTGLIAAIDPKSDVVFFFPKLASAVSVENPTKVKVGTLPSGVAFKRFGNDACFLVLCAGDKTLYLIDPVKLQVTAKIEVSDKNPTSLSVVQDAASPYVYCIADHDAMLADGTYRAHVAHRINLATRADDGIVMPDINSCEEVAVSSDGKWLYGRCIDQTPEELHAFRINSDAKTPTVTEISSFHEESKRYIPDAVGKYVMNGVNLYSTDLREGKALLSIPDDMEWNTRHALEHSLAACFLPDRPVFFFRAGNKISAFSYNTLKPLSYLRIPDLAKAAGSRKIPNPLPDNNNHTENLSRFGELLHPYYPSLLASQKDGSLVVIDDWCAAVVPISVFKLPDAPMLSVDVRGSTTVAVDDVMTLKLVKGDPNIAVSIGTAPKGVKITADTLTWTPASEDVGEKTITIKLTSPDGKTERTQTVDAIVQRPVMQLGFTPEQIKLSPDGKLALLVGTLGGNPPGQDSTSSTRLSLLDINQRKIVVDRIFPHAGRSAAIDNQNVYFSFNDSDAMNVLSRKDLTDVKRIFTKGQITGMSVVGNKMLYVSTTSPQNGGETGTTSYNLPDLTVNATTKSFGYNPFGNPDVPLAVGDCWYFKGLLYDQNFEKIRMVIQPEGFTFANRQGYARNNINYVQEGRQPVIAWGVQIQNNELRRQTGQSICTITGQAFTLLPDVPLMASLVLSNDVFKEQGTARYSRCQLVLQDLVTGETISTQTLLEQRMRDQYPSGDFTGDPVQLIAVPGQLVAQVGDRMLFVNTKNLPVAKAPMPLHFPLEQSAFLADPSQLLTLDMKAVGGKAPLEYTVSPESPAVSMDSATGKLTVDASKAVDAYVDAISQSLSNMPGIADPNPQPASQYADALKRYRASTTGAFVAITGKEPKGVPILLPLTVTAKDSEQLSTEISFSVLLDVPADRIEARIKKTADDQANEHERMVKAYQEQMRASAPPTTESAQLQDKLSELEKRNVQLEAQVQLLKELLKQRMPQHTAIQPATQP